MRRRTKNRGFLVRRRTKNRVDAHKNRGFYRGLGCVDAVDAQETAV